MDLSVETVDFIKVHLNDDVRKLALSSHPDGVDMHAALVQISGYQTATVKLPEWAASANLLWPEHLPLEQCTGQQLALFKADIVDGILEPGFRMADMTGGMGVDCFYLSRNAGDVLYNDLNPDLCSLAAHNLPLLGRCVSVSNVRAEDFLNGHPGEHFGLLYIDPARRSSSGRKLVSLKDCMPDMTLMQNMMLEMSDFVIVKMSPMLDISTALRELKCVKQLWCLSLCGECKELLAVMQPGFSDETEIIAVNISMDGIAGRQLRSTLSADGSLQQTFASEDGLTQGCCIYEPFAAHMKSGLYRTICSEYGVRQLHPNSHLFVSDAPVVDFPGRMFRIVENVGFDRRSATGLFRTYPQANITVRNFPMTADELRNRFKVRDGGTHYVFATTVNPNKKVLIVCER